MEEEGGISKKPKDPSSNSHSSFNFDNNELFKKKPNFLLKSDFGESSDSKYEDSFSKTPFSEKDNHGKRDLLSNKFGGYSNGNLFRKPPDMIDENSNFAEEEISFPMTKKPKKLIVLFLISL